MGQALRRVFPALALVALLTACGSDDDKKSNRADDVTKDAGTPDKPDKPDAATGGGKAGSKSDEPVKTAQSCADVKCKEPATCSEKDGKASCGCPDGYDDKKGDGSECVEKSASGSECDADQCGKHARCEKTDNGSECKCQGPAYEGDGKKDCTCAKGYAEKDGLCLADDGSKCGDNLDCGNGHCVGKICCAQACSSPDGECLSADEATCDDGHTCKYPVAKDGAACEDEDACSTGSTCKGGKCQAGTEPISCDDKNPCTDDSCDKTIGCKNQSNTASCDDGNPCTTGDVCAGGSCSSATVRDCSSEADACNAGQCDPANGNCRKMPIADGTKCDDSSTCTVTDQCNAGACKGQGNACGPNASACVAGTPNSCTCAADYKDQGGRCVPNNDECAANPCSPNADCFDPSNDPNTVTCKCKTGFEGDGKTCTATHPCEANPCGDGRGTCTEGTLGTYTCSCGAGYKAVGNTCVCDMTGTFAVKSDLGLSWGENDGFEPGKQVQTLWSIERHSYDANGELEIELIACGETPVDLCGTGVGGLVAPEAYSQYIPAAVWARANPPVTGLKLSLPKALPNEPFVTPNIPKLEGISLTDPGGAWPATRQDVAGTSDSNGTSTNGARWVDAENDGFIGVTTFTVGPNGAAADGSPTAPDEAFGTRSVQCPRNNANATRLPYNYPPAAEGLTVRRIKRFSSANRVTTRFEGKIDSCDQISGKIAGPAPGNQPQFDTRIGGCVRVNGTGETACAASVLDFLDSTSANGNTVDSSSFVTRRVADTITCPEVRKIDFSK